MKKTSCICFLSSAPKKTKGKLKPAVRKVIAPAVARRLAELRAVKAGIAKYAVGLKAKLDALEREALRAKAELDGVDAEMKELAEAAEQLGLA